MTTKSQEAFEALFKEVFPIQHHDWFEKDSLGYVSNSTNNGYKLYLATRKQALEHAYSIYEAAQELSHVKDGLRELMK